MRTKSRWLLIIALAVLVSSLQCNAATSLLNRRIQPEEQAQPEENQQLPDLPDQNQNLPEDQGELAPVNQDYQLEGIWVSDTDTGFGTVMHTELILEYTGTFSQQATAGDLMTYDVGTYVVGDGFIHFVVEKHEPEEYMGKRMSWITSFTYFYDFIDENTIHFEDRVMGGDWIAYRK